MSPVVSAQRPLNHYVWGEGCDGWALVDKPELSVKQERMPPHTAEAKHYHRVARQFFFILQGTAVFETNEGRVEVAANEGFEIEPGLVHRILNESEVDLVFVLCSQPSTANDREMVPTGDKENSPSGPIG
jgi:mannose-6-phosphate isomerase-like protein (cupin superfamily)